MHTTGSHISVLKTTEATGRGVRCLEVAELGRKERGEEHDDEGRDRDRPPICTAQRRSTLHNDLPLFLFLFHTHPLSHTNPH
eukprot:2558672-Rhodomonas_salina.2